MTDRPLNVGAAVGCGAPAASCSRVADSRVTVAARAPTLIDLPGDVLTMVVGHLDLATHGQAARASPVLRSAVAAVYAPRLLGTRRPSCFSGERWPTAVDLRRIGFQRPLTTIAAGELYGALLALTPPGPPAHGGLAAWWKKALWVSAGGEPGVGLQARLLVKEVSASRDPPKQWTGFYIGDLDAQGRPHGFGQASLCPAWEREGPDELQYYVLGGRGGEDELLRGWLRRPSDAELSYLGEWRHGRRHGIGATEYDGSDTAEGTITSHRLYADDVPLDLGPMGNAGFAARYPADLFEMSRQTDAGVGGYAMRRAETFMRGVCGTASEFEVVTLALGPSETPRRLGFEEVRWAVLEARMAAGAPNPRRQTWEEFQEFRALFPALRESAARRARAGY